MNPSLTYLAVDLGCFVVPFLFSFHKKIAFHRNFKALLIALLAMMSLFIPWDSWFTQTGIWHFNHSYIIGIKLFNLPLEEILFFACIPFSCLFTWHCFRIFFPDRISNFSNILAGGILLVNFILIVLYFDHAYTVSANAISALCLAYFLLYQRIYIKNLLLTWCVLLLPFFISNGILTGLHFYNFSLFNVNLMPENYIVGYNNTENLGFRIWTVPVEDFFYGLGMYALSAAVYLRYQSRLDNSTTTAR